MACTGVMSFSNCILDEINIALTSQGDGVTAWGSKWRIRAFLVLQHVPESLCQNPSLGMVINWAMYKYTTGGYGNALHVVGKARPYDGARHCTYCNPNCRGAQSEKVTRHLQE